MARLSQPTPDEGRTADDEGCRVLHVDDDKLQTELVARQLPKTDDRLVVETATSVDEAVERFDAETFHAVVTDFDMGSADATDLLSRLEDRNARVPTILFTGRDAAGLAPANVLDRVDEYLRKGSNGDCYGVLADLVLTAVDRTESPRPMAISAD